eukprot:6327119-Prymnesium_polylepis.4
MRDGSATTTRSRQSKQSAAHPFSSRWMAALSSAEFGVAPPDGSGEANGAKGAGGTLVALPGPASATSSQASQTAPNPATKCI